VDDVESSPSSPLLVAGVLDPLVALGFESLAPAAVALAEGRWPLTGTRTVLTTWMTQTFVSRLWPGAQFAKPAVAGAGALAVNDVGAVAWGDGETAL
jgi:hypothetical protein